MARSRLKAIRDAQLTINLLTRLGFTIHPEKIQVNPAQSIEALGTQVNSVKMQFLVPRSKRKSLLRKCFDTLRVNAQHKLTARKYASLIGTLNAVRGQSPQLLYTFGLFFTSKRLFSQSFNLGTSRSTSPLE